MNVEIRDQRFRTVVGDDVEIEEVGSGFEFTEGPIWITSRSIYLQ